MASTPVAPTPTTTTVATDVQTVQSVAGTVLATIEALDPGLSGAVTLTEDVITELGALVTAALNAWSNAAGQPINATTIAALFPYPTPLPEPPAGS